MLMSPAMVFQPDQNPRYKTASIFGCQITTFGVTNMAAMSSWLEDAPS